MDSFADAVMGDCRQIVNIFSRECGDFRSRCLFLLAKAWRLLSAEEGLFHQQVNFAQIREVQHLMLPSWQHIATGNCPGSSTCDCRLKLGNHGRHVHGNMKYGLITSSGKLIVADCLCSRLPLRSSDDKASLWPKENRFRSSGTTRFQHISLGYTPTKPICSPARRSERLLAAEDDTFASF